MMRAFMKVTVLMAVLPVILLIPALLAPAPAIAGNDAPEAKAEAKAEPKAEAKAEATPETVAETVPQTTPEQATKIHIGDTAPDFELLMADGSTFKLSDHRGKVVLVNFWATWCPPCVAEMPHLRDEVLPRFSASEFVMVCISREETTEKISDFAKAKKVTELPIGADVDRSIYARYADHTIPRNFVVGPDGVVLFQSVGFEEPDFMQMISVIEAAVGAEAR